MTTKRERALSSPSHAYSYLNGLQHALRTAERELREFLWDCHEDEALWEEMTYEKMAVALQCSRQAVQQRVLRMLQLSELERREEDPNHPHLPYGDDPF